MKPPNLQPEVTALVGLMDEPYTTGPLHRAAMIPLRPLLVISSSSFFVQRFKLYMQITNKDHGERGDFYQF